MIVTYDVAPFVCVELEVDVGVGLCVDGAGRDEVVAVDVACAAEEVAADGAAVLDAEGPEGAPFWHPAPNAIHNPSAQKSKGYFICILV